MSIQREFMVSIPCLDRDEVAAGNAGSRDAWLMTKRQRLL
jgi:hypothetical protein